MDVVRKIYKNDKIKAISLPDGFGDVGKFVKWEIINEKEIKGIIV